MRNRFTPKCTHCGKRYPVGNTHGIPNMVGFELENGRTINICQECLMKLGTMTKAQKDEFMLRITKDE